MVEVSEIAKAREARAAKELAAKQARELLMLDGTGTDNTFLYTAALTNVGNGSLPLTLDDKERGFAPTEAAANIFDQPSDSDISFTGVTAAATAATSAAALLNGETETVNGVEQSAANAGDILAETAQSRAHFNEKAEEAAENSTSFFGKISNTINGFLAPPPNEKMAAKWGAEEGYDASIFTVEKLTDDMLIANESFIEAAKVVYTMETGDSHEDSMFYKTDEDVARWAIGHARGMQMSLLNKASNAAEYKLKGTDEDQNAALSYVKDAFDRKAMESGWAGAQDVLASTAWVAGDMIVPGGVVGKAATKGIQMAANSGRATRALTGAGVGATTGVISGAGWGAADGALDGQINYEAGLSEERFIVSDIQERAKVGALFGGALGGPLGGLVGGLSRRAAANADSLAPDTVLQKPAAESATPQTFDQPVQQAQARPSASDAQRTQQDQWRAAAARQSSVSGQSDAATPTPAQQQQANAAGGTPASGASGGAAAVRSNAAAGDLPPFDPSIDRAKLMARVLPVLDGKPTRALFPVAAFRQRAYMIARPVNEYVDNILHISGLAKDIQKLHTDILGSDHSGASVSRLANDFANDPSNIARLDDFRSQMVTLRDHIESTYKTNRELNKNGKEDARWTHDLTTGQKKNLVEKVQAQIDLVDDLKKGDRSQNVAQINETLSRVSSGEFDLRELQDSYTGLSFAHMAANTSEIRRTGLWMDGKRKAPLQLVESEERHISEEVFTNAPHRDRPISYALATEENLEKKWMNQNLRDLLARKENGDLAVDYGTNVEAKKAYVQAFKGFIEQRQGEKAIMTVRQHAMLAHPKGASDKMPFPEAGMITVALKDAGIDMSDPYTKKIYDKMYDIVDEYDKAPRPAASKTATGIKETIFENNRVNAHKAEAMMYPIEYGTLYKGMGQKKWWSLGQDVTGPIKIMAGARVAHYQTSPLKWFAGYHTNKPGVRDEFSMQQDDYVSTNSLWRGGEGKDKETVLAPVRRIALRIGTAGLISDIKMSTPLSLLNPRNYEPTKLGWAAIGGAGMWGVGNAADIGWAESLGQSTANLALMPSDAAYTVLGAEDNWFSEARQEAGGDQLSAPSLAGILSDDTETAAPTDTPDVDNSLSITARQALVGDLSAQKSNAQALVDAANVAYNNAKANDARINSDDSEATKKEYKAALATEREALESIETQIDQNQNALIGQLTARAAQSGSFNDLQTGAYKAALTTALAANPLANLGSAANHGLAMDVVNSAGTDAQKAAYDSIKAANKVNSGTTTDTGTTPPAGGSYTRDQDLRDRATGVLQDAGTLGGRFFRWASDTNPNDKDANVNVGLGMFSKAASWVADTSKKAKGGEWLNWAGGIGLAAMTTSWVLGKMGILGRVPLMWLAVGAAIAFGGRKAMSSLFGSDNPAQGPGTHLMAATQNGNTVQLPHNGVGGARALDVYRDGATLPPAPLNAPASDDDQSSIRGLFDRETDNMASADIGASEAAPLDNGSTGAVQVSTAASYLPAEIIAFARFGAGEIADAQENHIPPAFTHDATRDAQLNPFTALASLDAVGHNGSSTGIDELDMDALMAARFANDPTLAMDDRPHFDA